MGRLSGSDKRENERLGDLVRQFRKMEDQAAFDEIVASLDGYIKYLAIKKFYFIAGYSSDDIYQEGLYALANKAIPDYREEKGAFLSFAKLCIKRHIITVLKSANNYKNLPLNGARSLDKPGCAENEDCSVPISSFWARDKEDEDAPLVLMRSEAHSNLKSRLMGRLTPLEARVLELYLRNMSYMDIVSEMNRRRRGKRRIKSKVVDNALCRIKNKAQELLGDGTAEDWT